MPYIKQRINWPVIIIAVIAIYALAALVDYAF